MPVDTSHLPPRPDPYTGQPRPPEAPLEAGTKRRPPHRLYRLARGEAKVPSPPVGQGRMLEWFYADRSSRLIAGMIIPVIGIIIYYIRLGPGWVTTWWLWLIIAPWPFVFLWSGRNERHSAGAEWLACSEKAWVRLYELTEIKITIVSGGMAQQLEIRDSHGEGLWVRVDVVQSNPKLWDLVYNGLIHSYHVNGAETNKRARDSLQLEYPPTVPQPW